MIDPDTQDFQGDILEAIGEIEAPLENLRGAIILITGTSGHLGYTFLHFLLAANKYFDLDMKIHSASTSALDRSFESYGDVLLHSRIDLTVSTDICGPTEYDCVIHLAGHAQPAKFLLAPWATIILNTTVVQELLNKVSSTGFFLFLSSSEIYSNAIGNDNHESVSGNLDPGHPRAPYFYGKLLGEAICNLDSNKEDRNIKIARLSMTYGPGIKKGDSRALSEFLESALFKKQIQLINNGEMTREYLYVTDAILALCKILLVGRSDLYNIGAGKAGRITIAGAAMEIARQTDSKVFIPRLSSDSLHARSSVDLNISRYESEFGNILRTPFPKGVEKTLNWLRYNWR